MNCELLSENNFKIHRKDRANRIGGGVMLAVRNNILSIRRKDLENDQTEMLACEIRPNTKKKLLILVFYRPPNRFKLYEGLQENTENSVQIKL